MEQYTTVCGVELPAVDPEKNYPLVFYRVSEDWAEFLRHDTSKALNKAQLEIADDDFRKKIAQAACTMYHSGGIGIAANQVGFKEDWFILDTKWTKTGVKAPRVVTKPNLCCSYFVEGETLHHEGCLSVPMGFKGDVPRHTAISLEYVNLKGETVVWDATDLDAACVSHELDHLRGVLFIDHISKLRRGFIEGKIKKVKKAVKHRIKNHNRQIIKQVKHLNQRAAFGARPKEEPLQVEPVTNEDFTS